ncbi:MAG TPA: hypothetical protein IGS53_21725 [Leptolyngbyaceae cyanobacterium M33_DOE_097]|uniref:TonB C-terminal domain-containing protein n=1 Tax=Oscillatoriales cyanobacterium SpSt-418 TaxID=2282169 RepID=A0A7C3PM93_9CYAN|nr:hypothetical protein [Leptolyngbyaceae cyanobacterium M33_DOE_097]
MQFSKANLNQAKSWAIAHVVPYLRTPATIALFSSVAIHGLILTAVPLKRDDTSKETKIRAVKVVELTPQELSRLPKTTAQLRDPLPGTTKSNQGLRYKPLPITPLPDLLPPLSSSSRSLGASSYTGSLGESSTRSQRQQVETQIPLDKPRKTSTSRKSESAKKTESDKPEKPDQTEKKQESSSSNEPLAANNKPAEEPKDNSGTEPKQGSPNQAASGQPESGQPASGSSAPTGQPEVSDKLAQKVGKPIDSGQAAAEYMAWRTQLLELKVPAKQIDKAQVNRDAPTLAIACPTNDCAKKIETLPVPPFFMMAVDKNGKIVGDILVAMTGDEALDRAIVAEIKKFKPEVDPQKEYTVINRKIKFQDTVS